MSMLASLVRAYQRLPDAAPYGYSTEKIGFCLVLSRDGSVAELIDLRDSDKKRSPKSMVVPACPKRSGQTPRPNFLWDNINYALGAGKLSDETDKRFDAFREKHLAYLSDLNDPEIQAFCAFLHNWNPVDVTKYFAADDLPTQGIVFASSGSHRDHFLHENHEATTFWQRERYLWVAVEGKSTKPAICLVNGELSEIARTHPPIKGMSGVGGKSEMALVSFNDNAYESYGHEQGDNAPVSEAAAFAYTTALNRFLERDSGHRIQIGDASTVFWADAAEAGAADEAALAQEAEGWGAFMLGDRAISGETETIAERQIRANLQRLREGRPLRDVAPHLDRGVRFHVLGLAPNAARLSVRLYWEDSFGELARHYTDWMRDTTIDAASLQPEFSIRAAVLRTAPAQIRNGKLSFDGDHVSPLLSGELLRAILTGGRFPRALLALLLMRIRSDRLLDRLRISLIKAVIVRDMRHENRLPRRPDNSIMEDYLMRPDPDDPNPARRLGRLFALIERAQLAALGDDINATVTDKFLGAAAATPARVFPDLLRNAKTHHLKRLRNGHSDAKWIKDAEHARRVANGLERGIGLLWASFPDGPEHQHSSEEQGLFLVGYYQEKYAKRDEAGSDLTEAPETDSED